MSTAYQEFLARKTRVTQPEGPVFTASQVHPFLHEWQRRIVAWAATVQRAAVWADTGLGKTLMQLEWARLVRGEQGIALVVAPLAVTRQTVNEAAKVGQQVAYVRHHSEITGPGTWITNYERVTGFDPSLLPAVVLDESSILKQSDGKTRNLLIRAFEDVPHRLACSATPAPNDPEELTSQAEFLGRASRTSMLAAYFVHDSDGWRLKGHARGPMFKWMAHWAVAMRRPSDVGFPDEGYLLPGLSVIQHVVEADFVQEGQLFATDLGGVGGRAAARRATVEQRCRKAAQLVAAEPDEPWILWCGLNDEAAKLAKSIPGAVNVHGGLSAEEKADAFMGFADGSIRVLVTKPSMASFGMNWQHCARMAFVGLSDSYEAYYQSMRRCHRYGQSRVVQAHIITTALESRIAENVRRKELEAARTSEAMVAAMRSEGQWWTTDT